jgi:hypothetical protein
VLLSLHQMIAAIVKQPLWEIDASEAKLLADGIYEVEKHYPVLLMTDREQAWWNLAQIVAMVHGPRASLALKMFLTGERAPATPGAARADGGANVSPLRPAPAPPPVPDGFVVLPGGGPSTGYTGATAGTNPPL